MRKAPAAVTIFGLNQGNERWSPNLRAVWGGEVWQETVKSPQNYNSSKTMRGEIARAFGNLEWRPHQRVLVQGGAMLEHHYFTGTDISPRVAVNFTVVPDHVLRLGAALPGSHRQLYWGKES